MDAAHRGKLDYLALGHWHSVKEISGNGDSVRMAYSGTPEPTAFGETDSGYVLLVDIEAHGARTHIEKRKTGELEWWNLNEEIREAGDLERVIKTVKQRRNSCTTLVKVQLTGVLFASDAGRLEELPDILSERFLYGQMDDSALVPAPEDDSWINNLPDGSIRQAGERLKRTAYEEKNIVARRALLDLYRFANGGVA
jgi:DNA repair exonuclease SbcCD nuclease subunit